MAVAATEEVMAFLKRAHDEFQSFALELRFDKRQAQHRTLVALYGSILELTSSCLHLIDHRLLSGVPVLLRSILEAYVDFVNLAADPKYGYSLERSYLREWRRLLQAARAGKNQYLQALTADPGLAGRIAEVEAEEKKLEMRGCEILSIEEKFRKVNMEEEYRSIYNSLCCDSHNNMRALIDRHIEFDSEDFALVFYKPYTAEDAEVYVGTNAEILVRATELLHATMQSTAAEKVAPYRAEMNRLRGDTG